MAILGYFRLFTIASSFIPQDIVGAYTTHFDHAFVEAQSQAVSLADADFEFICPTLPFFINNSVKI
jgi:hypothetical protein